ncbi:MAG TPA: type 4a pilus biogenesis protein PilO [Vicinamibacterales bacterium]|nr:type 4a pilus biogenesis protein PilO [Vicinamibacterales bacterium]
MAPSLNKLPWYYQIGLFLLLAAAGVYVFYIYYAAPAEADLHSRRTELVSLQADINTGLANARRLPQFRARVQVLQAQLNDLKTILPEQKDVADLLRRMQALAVESNLTIRGFKPEPTVTKALHVEWPISLQLDGSYNNLAVFFDRISRFPRIIDVSDIDIRAKPKQEPGSTITASCKATTFVLIDKPATAAKPAAGKRQAPAGRKTP